MPTNLTDRLLYGPKKYAGLHLLLCRWLRMHAQPATSYSYVTLGGTELRDIHSLSFIDLQLLSGVWSYESDPKRYALAAKSAEALAALGITIRMRDTTFFSHTRQSENPHIFFLDLTGICAWGDYDQQFGEMFQNEVIREGDCLLITSHLGHHRGTFEIRELFRGEFAVLGINLDDNDRVRNIYRRAHPSMTLFKGLCDKGIHRELQVRCFGTVKYKDHGRTPMGIYGYALLPGATELKTLVEGGGTDYFDLNSGELCSPDRF